MSAGRGILHSEYNPSADQQTRFLQIWIHPEHKGLAPSYEQAHLPAAGTPNALRLVASPDGSQGSVHLHQDVRLYAAVLDKGHRIEHRLATGRHAWVQVVSGELMLGSEAANGELLKEGDGAAISDAAAEFLEGRGADDRAEVLLFDLA